MQELAHKGTDSPLGGRRPSGNLPSYTGGCPSAETLAAYIDGVLDPVEAERVTAHLADCEDCYAVYSDSVRFLLEAEPEEGEEDGGGTVVPFPQPRPLRDDRRPWLQPLYQIAALLLIGIGTGGVYFLWEPPALMTAQVAAPIPNRTQVFDNTTGLWTGPVYRGEGSEVDVNLDEAAFRTGVQLVNLQVSLQAGKVDEAQNAIAAILGLLDAGVLTQDLQKKYEGLTGSLESRPPGSFLPEASKLAAETREVFETGSLDFGQWVEAGRLAAAAGDPGFFQQSGTQSFLRRLLWRDRLGLGEVQLDGTTRQSLEEVSRILSKRELAASDYSKLTDELGRVLDTHYPISG